MKILFMMPAAKGVYPPEADERRKKLISSYATSDVQIDIVYMPGVSGFQPFGATDATDREADDLARAHELSSDCALQAEKDGYDAFLPFGLLDIGVKRARERGLRIPAVGAAESSALFCGMLGRKFASCSYLMSPDVEAQHLQAMIPLGLQDLYVATTQIGIPNSEFPKRRDEVLARFVLAAEEARSKGAEIMAQNAMSICPTEFSAKELAEASGMPVIDSIASQIAMAQFWHGMGLPANMLAIPRQS